MHTTWVVLDLNQHKLRTFLKAGRNGEGQSAWLIQRQDRCDPGCSRRLHSGLQQGAFARICGQARGAAEERRRRGCLRRCQRRFCYEGLLKNTPLFYYSKDLQWWNFFGARLGVWTRRQKERCACLRTLPGKLDTLLGLYRSIYIYIYKDGKWISIRRIWDFQPKITCIIRIWFVYA